MEETMTAEEFAERIETLIEAGRAGGLSDTAIRDALEEAAEALDEGIT
jgi:hypothetical protein